MQDRLLQKKKGEKSWLKNYACMQERKTSVPRWPASRARCLPRRSSRRSLCVQSLHYLAFATAPETTLGDTVFLWFCPRTQLPARDLRPVWTAGDFLPRKPIAPSGANFRAPVCLSREIRTSAGCDRVSPAVSMPLSQPQRPKTCFWDDVQPLSKLHHHPPRPQTSTSPACARRGRALS